MGRTYPPRKLADRIAAKVFRGQGAETWHEAHMRYLSIAGEYGLLGYAREVYIDMAQWFDPETLETYLPHFRSFTRVHTLRITGFDIPRFLPAFERYFEQFVPTLRSLHLPYVTGGIYEVLEFICKFPHLDDLSITLSSSHCIDIPSRFSMEHSPPLRGTLLLRGWSSIPAQFLLKIPRGLHFRSINAGGVEKVELDEILAACSLNLETLSLCPLSRKSTQYHCSSGKICCRSLNNPLCYTAVDAVDLSGNLLLARFELRVKSPDDLTLALPSLRKTLLTISSPAFSEFTLKLEGIPMGIRFFQLLPGEVVWRDEWGMIDRDLNDMAQVVGREIRLVVQIEAAGGVWSPTLGGRVGDVFPLMNARGLVSVRVGL